MSGPGQIRSCDDVRGTTALPPKAKSIRDLAMSHSVGAHRIGNQYEYNGDDAARLAQGDCGRAAGRHNDFWRERGARLYRLNADRRNDLVPIVDLGGDEAGEFFGRAAHCVQALKLHLGDDVRRF